MRFETIEQAQAYLDRWDTRWADYPHPRHDQAPSRRDVCGGAASALQPLPLEPFRYYRFGVRTGASRWLRRSRTAAVHRRAAGWIGRASTVQWNDLFVRLLDPKTGSSCASMCARRAAGTASTTPNAARTAAEDLALLSAAHRPPRQPICDHIHRRGRGGPSHPRRPRAGEEHGPASSRAAKPRSISACRRIASPPYLERAAVPLTCVRSIRSFVSSRLYRDLIDRQEEQETRMNLVELDRALRQLRLSGMAAVLDTRLRQAQAEEDDTHRPRLRARGRRTATPTRPAA
jgi:hypothetical protein